MAHTAADVLVEGLVRWRVNVVFGLPGDGINGVMEALRKRRGEVRHEEAAALVLALTGQTFSDLKGAASSGR